MMTLHLLIRTVRPSPLPSGNKWKYAGYLARQKRQVEEFKREETRLLPPDLDYHTLSGLRLEARQKLSEIRPVSIGQAGRISGVSPADIAVLLIYLEQHPQE